MMSGADIGCSLENCQERWIIGTDGERARERVKEICASSMT